MTEKFNQGRRNILKAGLLTATSIVAERLPFAKKISNLAQEPDKENIEKKKLPNEKFIPKLMKNYMEPFEFWEDVNQNQRQMIYDFVDSYIYKTSLLRIAKRYIPEVSDDIMMGIVEDLIVKRKNNVLKVKERFTTLKEDFGQYHSATNIIWLDINSNYMQPDYEKRMKEDNSVSMNITNFAHELGHAIHDKTDYTFYPEVIAIYNALLASKQARAYISEDEIKKRIEAIKHKKGIVTSETNEPEKDKGSRPNEIQSYMLQIRLVLHIVMNTNEEFANSPIKFDMTKEKNGKFTEEHLKFLFENHKKMFGVDLVVINGKKVENNTFLAVMRRFDNQTFIELMNTVL